MNNILRDIGSPDIISYTQGFLTIGYAGFATACTGSKFPIFTGLRRRPYTTLGHYRHNA